MDDGYPSALTAAEADREELNWDRVFEADLIAALQRLDDKIDLVAVGYNAGQGLPLALAVPAPRRSV